MWDTVLSAAEWIVDAILKRSQWDRAARNDRWIRVATYFDELANAIDSVLADFQGGMLAFRGYAQLKTMADEFPHVLSKVYNKRKPDENEQIQNLCRALARVIRTIWIGDRGLHLDKERDPKSPGAQIIIANLETAAGHFRGMAVSLRTRSS